MDNTPEPNQDLENAANALNEAATQTEAPVVEETTTETAVEETVVAENTVNEAAAGEVKEEPAVSAPATETPVIEAPAVAAAPVEKAVKEKKGGKKGLIIGGAVAAVALVGGGIAVYSINNNPENIALSAFSNFLSSKTMAVSGTFSVAANNDSDLSNIKVTIKNDKNAAGETNTSATLAVTYAGKDFTINLGSVVLKDYTIYVQVDGLKTAVKDALKIVENTDYEEYAELYEDLIDTVVGEIDGVWWKISVPELVDEIDLIESSQKTKIKEVYNCVVDTAEKAVNKGDDYAKIYKDNAFVKLAKHEGSDKFSGKGTAYDLTLDAAKLTSFSNAMTKEIDSLGFETCVEKLNDVEGAKGTYTVTEVKEEDVKKAIDELPKIVVTIDGGFFNYDLTGLYVNFSEDAYTGKIDLNFSKDVPAVTAPNGAKSVTELYTNVVKAYTEWQATSTCKVLKSQYPTYYNTYCDAQTNKVKPEYESMFNSSSMM